jgi:hypothetical protein
VCQLLSQLPYHRVTAAICQDVDLMVTPVVGGHLPRHPLSPTVSATTLLHPLRCWAAWLANLLELVLWSNPPFVILPVNLSSDRAGNTCGGPRYVVVHDVLVVRRCLWVMVVSHNHLCNFQWNRGNTFRKVSCRTCHSAQSIRTI